MWLTGVGCGVLDGLAAGVAIGVAVEVAAGKEGVDAIVGLG
jgi:hypothetical protein